MGFQGELFSKNEYAAYLDKSKPGYFHVAQKRDHWVQQAHPLAKMDEVIDALDKRYDSYISQAEYLSPRTRRVVNVSRVGLLFSDLDIYNTSLGEKTPGKAAEVVVLFCLESGIPGPSLILFSGRGLQVKWILENPIPRAALPRWNLIQGVLSNKLNEVGADRSAKDAARVLRLVGTVNTKTGEKAKVLYCERDPSGHLRRYNFEYMAETLLPYSRQESALYKTAKATQGSPGKAKWPFTQRSLSWARLEDLRRLVQLRGGGIDEGGRHTHLFWATNFLLASKIANSSTMYYEVKALARDIDPEWRYSEKELSTLYKRAQMHDRGEKIEWQGKLYEPFYRAKNSTLIDALGITTEEQRGLTTIIDSREKVRRRNALRAKMARQEYQEDRRNRKEMAIEMACGGVSRLEIQKRLAISERTLRNYLEDVKRDKACLLYERAENLKKEGYTQKEVAQILGISQSQVSRMGRGGRSESGGKRREYAKRQSMSLI